MPINPYGSPTPARGSVCSGQGVFFWFGLTFVELRSANSSVFAHTLASARARQSIAPPRTPPHGACRRPSRTQPDRTPPRGAEHTAQNARERRGAVHDGASEVHGCPRHAQMRSPHPPHRRSPLGTFLCTPVVGCSLHVQSPSLRSNAEFICRSALDMRYGSRTFRSS